MRVVLKAKLMSPIFNENLLFFLQKTIFSCVWCDNLPRKCFFATSTFPLNSLEREFLWEEGVWKVHFRIKPLLSLLPHFLTPSLILIFNKESVAAQNNISTNSSRKKNHAKHDFLTSVENLFRGIEMMWQFHLSMKIAWTLTMPWEKLRMAWSMQQME